MAASDYVPIFFKKPLASRGASTDEYTPCHARTASMSHLAAKPQSNLAVSTKSKVASDQLRESSAIGTLSDIPMAADVKLL